MVGIIAWLLIGAILAGMAAPSRHFSFSAGRSACLLGGMAGGFLGGGTLTVATGATQSGLYIPASLTAAIGASLVIVAVAWAGRAAPYSVNGPNRSAR